MQPEAISQVIERIQMIESGMASIREAVESEDLGTSDRRYLSRCFDLLNMELRALKQYLLGLN